MASKAISKIYQQPLLEPVGLTEAKNYLKIENNEDDDLIESLIATVRQSAENFLKISLITQGWSMLFDNYLPKISAFQKGPVQNIDSIILYDKNNVQTILDSSKYYLTSGNNSIIFDASIISHKSEIRYITGFGDNGSDVPSPIRQAMLLHLSAIYEGRSGVDTIPDHAKELYKPYIVYLI